MNIVGELVRTREETMKCFSLPEPDLSRSYGHHKWTIRQLLVHLADAETVLLYRVKKVLAEGELVVWAFDQDKWNTALHYNTYPLDLARNLYLAQRDTAIYLAETFYAVSGNYRFVHSQTGSRTLRDEIEKIATHNQHHLDQMAIALLHP